MYRRSCCSCLLFNTIIVRFLRKICIFILSLSLAFILVSKSLSDRVNWSIERFSAGVIFFGLCDSNLLLELLIHLLLIEFWLFFWLSLLCFLFVILSFLLHTLWWWGWWRLIDLFYFLLLFFFLHYNCCCCFLSFNRILLRLVFWFLVEIFSYLSICILLILSLTYLLNLFHLVHWFCIF